MLSSSYFILEVTGWGEKCYIAYYFLKAHLVQKSPHSQENFSSTQHSPLLLRASLQHTQQSAPKSFNNLPFKKKRWGWRNGLVVKHTAEFGSQHPQLHRTPSPGDLICLHTRVHRHIHTYSKKKESQEWWFTPTKAHICKISGVVEVCGYTVNFSSDPS